MNTNVLEFKSKFRDKIVYASRNNNLESNLVMRMVDVLSDNDNEKVVINQYIPYLINFKDRDMNSVGKYFNWGLMQIPGYLFLKLKDDCNFVTDNVINLLNPIQNLDVGCKIIRYLKKDDYSIDHVLYKYITCHTESLSPSSALPDVLKIVSKILTY